jgi:hypothetical protein
MGRPVVEDKLRQIPVPVRQSMIDAIGKKELIERLKDFITKQQ